ncbi:hypothetical protein Mic7113_6063 [Allocoleopsis franciscana PCC 7113]|uniref:Uncharacterized protein n=1 Tax=Allocoleopsis franciscana PCC 7113 TaxID=1173027 RepID=K9WQ47_9CYAN|nr:hypothetical protein Mic7113_6063 [Allocoleopsis franciscana PCC 7113]
MQLIHAGRNTEGKLDLFKEIIQMTKVSVKGLGSETVAPENEIGIHLFH